MQNIRKLKDLFKLSTVHKRLLYINLTALNLVFDP